MDEIRRQLAEQFQPQAFAEWIAGTTPGLLVATLIIAGFYLLWRMLRGALDAIKARENVDPTLLAFFRSVIGYVLAVVAVLMVLDSFGVDTRSIIASLGIAGLTIGFAARDALSNVISGIFIFWDRPFVVGDLIEIGDLYGRVEEVTLRSTRVVTPDGRMLAIPNSTVVNSTVASYTNFPHLRLGVEVTVAVDQDLDAVRETFLDVVDGNPAFMTDPKPDMVVTALNDYNVAVELRVWLDDEKRHLAERFALREAVYKAFTKAGIDMPYETIDINPIEVRRPAS